MSDDEPARVDVPASVHVDAWDRRVELWVDDDETSLKVGGPWKTFTDSGAKISLVANLEDEKYDNAGGQCSIQLSREAARKLRDTLSELIEADASIVFDHSGAATDGDSA